MPGNSRISPDSWNIEYLWTRPLSRVTGRQTPERLPLSERLRRNADLHASAGRSLAARARLLAELARIDSQLGESDQ